VSSIVSVSAWFFNLRGKAEKRFRGVKHVRGVKTSRNRYRSGDTGLENPMVFCFWLNINR
jgi:hypothetical protein